jgi:hypothetical protein
MNAVAANTLNPWRALFWEPVSGTGERIMVGVVYKYAGIWGATRVLRNDVLACLYGKSSVQAQKLIDLGISMFLEAARASDSLASLDVPMAGIYSGELRATSADSIADLLRISALLYSSMANLDLIDDLDEADAPTNEEVTRRFTSDVRRAVIQRRPTYDEFFGRASVLRVGGDEVRFGFLSPKAIIHFNILHHVRLGPSIRDARARLFELQQCVKISGIRRSTLISAVPRDDDAMLGDKQRSKVLKARTEIAGEADGVGIEFKTVHNAVQAASFVIEAQEAA